MKKELSSHGNSWQLYLSKPIAQFLGISKEEYTVLFNIKNKILYVERIKNEDIQKYKNFLCKKLIKRGSGFGLNIPLPVLELLDINPESDFVDYNINGTTLFIKKAE